MARRLSTGGQAPVRIETCMQVERVQTHDGAPCYSAWKSTRPYGSDEDHTTSRSPWGLQVYDTRPGCDGDHSRLKELALRLHEDTWDARGAEGRDEPDRVDLYALPMPSSATDEERAEKCKAHYLTERKARNARGVRGASHYIPPVRRYSGWKHVILTIAKAEEDWDKGEGGFLLVQWQTSTGCHKGYESWSREARQHQCLSRAAYLDGGEDGLGGTLRKLREGIEGFLIHHWHPGYEDEPEAEDGYRVVYCRCEEFCHPKLANDSSAATDKGGQQEELPL
ncbi:uncharacterized protein E0L32_010333 [Thyridium curvatum]|uniref:Uncharacterized protein n=1 Tax=Thyridium curvatum TaxID=1093900 RepID=A0A507AGN0_9PEZI|nr:uncharacterized protein E0L32_010333 [Thyridium curvatum]TPX08002.1 hypothetical protein E0L32_010333 [Thyridium curvatum]